MAYDLPISLQKMLYMEETYRTNSFLFKNKKEGLINFRTVSYILGILVFVEAGLFAICAGISAFYHENSYIYFIWTMLMNIGIGGIMVLAGNRRCNNISRRDGYCIVSISWILFTLLGMLPFYLSGHIPSITDAFFETMSGFTTTGATILNNIESLPHGLLFWRSFTQWIGGLGIVLFTIALLPLFSGSSQQLFLSEATGVTHDKIHPKIKVMARYLWLIYIGLTLLETILLMLGGMNLFDALCQAFATTATGGFSTKQDSISYWNSPYIEYVVSIFMILSGVNFSLYNPQIQISAESGTKRSIFRQKNKTKRSKKRLRTTLIKSEQKVNETSVPALYFRKNTFRMAF